MKKILYISMAVLLCSVTVSCERDEPTPVPTPVTEDITTTLLLPEGGRVWNEGDVVDWIDEDGNATRLCITGENIVNDSTASVTLPVKRIEGRDTKGYFSIGTKADGTCPFTLEDVPDSNRVFTLVQETSGVFPRSIDFHLSSKGYETIEKGCSTFQSRLSPIGCRIAIIPFGSTIGEEKIVSVSIKTPGDNISGSVVYDHKLESRGGISSYATSQCTTVLESDLDIASAADSSNALFFNIPITSIGKRQIIVTTDVAVYTLNLDDRLDLKDGATIWVKAFLDEAIRKEGSDITIPVKLNGISFDWDEFTIEAGCTRQIKVSFSPEKATYKTLIWTSSDPSVATVEDGLVKGISAGQTQVIATNLAGNIADTCNVFINPADYRDRNAHYNVFIKTEEGEWRSVEVHDALCSDNRKHEQIWNDWNNSKKLRDTMSFAIFEDPFDAPVTIRVQKRNGAFSKAEVRPTKYGINADIVNDGCIEFTLPSYECRKVSVEFDGDRTHNLFLFGNRPEQDFPDIKSPDVLYFGPGEHYTGVITLRSRQTLYIDYGAVVHGNVEVVGNNCTIAGHGILSGEKLPHTGNSYATGSMLIQVNKNYWTNYGENFSIRDVTLIDSPSWTLDLTRCRYFSIDGVNIICWILNGDGIDLVCDAYGEIKNCFIRAYDDCISLKMNNNYLAPIHDTEHIEISNNIFYNDLARGIVIGPEGGGDDADYGKTGSIHDINIHDCIFLRDSGSTTVTNSTVQGAFAIYQSMPSFFHYRLSGANPFERITARNLYFDNLEKTGRPVIVYQDGRMTAGDSHGESVISDVLFENFEVIDGNRSENPACYIKTNHHSIKGLKIKNFTVDGQKITEPDDRTFVVDGNVEIEFE